MNPSASAGMRPGMCAGMNPSASPGMSAVASPGGTSPGAMSPGPDGSPGVGGGGLVSGVPTGRRASHTVLSHQQFGTPPACTLYPAPSRGALSHQQLGVHPCAPAHAHALASPQRNQPGASPAAAISAAEEPAPCTVYPVPCTLPAEEDPASASSQVRSSQVVTLGACCPAAASAAEQEEDQPGASTFASSPPRWPHPQALARPPTCTPQREARPASERMAAHQREAAAHAWGTARGGQQAGAAGCGLGWDVPHTAPATPTARRSWHVRRAHAAWVATRNWLAEIGGGAVEVVNEDHS